MPHEVIDHGRMNLNADSAHHLVRVSWHEMMEGGDFQTHEGWISPEDALGLVHNLVSAASSAFSDQVDSALAGDCKRCKNTHFVDVKKPGGYTASEHCPVCWPKIVQPLPTIPALADREAQVLR